MLNKWPQVTLSYRMLIVPIIDDKKYIIIYDQPFTHSRVLFWENAPNDHSDLDVPIGQRYYMHNIYKIFVQTVHTQWFWDYRPNIFNQIHQMHQCMYDLIRFKGRK